ncbi:MAG: glycosyltransferase family A protein [Paludibacter sp.]
MFSIIIPLYNKAPYIRKALESVFAQTYTDFELIVVDDGSTDNSLENLRFTIHDLQLSDEKIRVIEQANRGVSTTRNNGVKLAKYDYIAFLDADDWWEPSYLEEMKRLIDEFPEAGIYGSNYYKVKHGKLIQANIGIEDGFERGLINYCRVYARTMYMPLTSITSVIKKSVFEKENGFKPLLRMGEDFDLWVRVAMKYPVALLNKPLAYYNQDVEQESRAIGEKLYEPEQHMLFTDYGVLNQNPDFRHLYEVLAVYGLLPYYLAGKNKKEVDKILGTVHWENHPFKYRLYYRFLPAVVVKFYLKIMKFGVQMKAKLKSKVC